MAEAKSTEATPEVTTAMQERFNAMFDTAMTAWIAKQQSARTKAGEEEAAKKTGSGWGFLDGIFPGRD